MRRDGFASMDAETTPGTLTTRPVRFSGKHLFVNADVSEGTLRVAVLDSDGQRNRTVHRRKLHSGSRELHPARVNWKKAANLAPLSGRPVRFRFELSKGAVYSFVVTP